MKIITKIKNYFIAERKNLTFEEWKTNFAKVDKKIFFKDKTIMAIVDNKLFCLLPINKFKKEFEKAVVRNEQYYIFHFTKNEIKQIKKIM